MSSTLDLHPEVVEIINENIKVIHLNLNSTKETEKKIYALTDQELQDFIVGYNQHKKQQHFGNDYYKRVKEQRILDGLVPKCAGRPRKDGSLSQPRKQTLERTVPVKRGRPRNTIPLPILV